MEESYTFQILSRGMRFFTFSFLNPEGVKPVLFRNCEDRC